jgi:Flp pilus assembly protein TadB
VTITRGFKQRMTLSVLCLVVTGALIGSGFALTARAQMATETERIEQARVDTRQDGQIETLVEKAADSAKERADAKARIESLEKDVAAVRGALWMCGAFLALLTTANIVITLRAGIKAIEREE